MKKVHLCDTLDIDDGIIREIIECLYRAKDDSISYDFSIIPADTLGTVYEQYLGHILKKTEKTAKLTENHAHRKEQGIYYTPVYIVDYIVRNTLGELLKDNKVKAENIKILDPACGSGSFLIKAFDFLDEYYRMNDEKYSQTELDLKTGGTYTRKLRILQNNIFGVDLDEKAVEIAQLNLLLKIAEKGHRLPLLEQNIKCGNSLIEDEKVAGDKAFKWEERFREIMKEGGFDIIIGNPPYIRNRELKQNEKQFMQDNFKTAEDQYDIYQLFLEKAINLMREDSLLGFITSNKYAITRYGTKIRKFILDTCQIVSIVDVSNIRVFKEASTYPYIIVLRKESNDRIRNSTSIKTLKTDSEEDLLKAVPQHIRQSEFLENESFVFNIGGDEKCFLLVRKIQEDSTKLGDIVTIKETVHTGNIRKKLITYSKVSESSKRLLRGKDCQRYYFKWQNLWIITNRGIIDKSKGEYATIPDDSYFRQPKLLLREIADRITSCYDDEGYYTLNKAYVLNQKEKKYSLKFILGLLNSKLLSWFFRINFESAHVRGGYLQFKKQYTAQLPIRNISEEEQQLIIKLVDKMISLNNRLKEIGDKRTDGRARIEEEIKKTDAEIDALVYEIYEITDTEKKIIEDNLK